MEQKVGNNKVKHSISKLFCVQAEVLKASESNKIKTNNLYFLKASDLTLILQAFMVI